MKQRIAYGDGNILSYTEYGDKNGYPILAQHGMIASITDFHLFDRLIASGVRLICMARPGYGESSPHIMKNMGEWAQVVAPLIDGLKLRQFDILGISSGAPYSYALGCRYPDYVRNIFILSGTPALYDENILSLWPYEVKKDADIIEMETLAQALFFSNLSPEDSMRDDIKDSMMNNCFGIAQDLKLRCMDWGFKLSDVTAKVYLRHSRADESVPFAAVEMTAKLLPNCRFDVREHDAHFSHEVLDDFIRTVMIGNYGQ